MKIVILGGETGKTGALAVEAALAEGNEVIAFVRRPEAVVARERLTVVGGSVEDSSAMAVALVGADAVVSALGVGVTPRIVLFGSDFQQRTLPHILNAMERGGKSLRTDVVVRIW